MSYGLAVEGEDGPYLGDQVSRAPTCDVGLTVGDARRALAGPGADLVIVVADGLAVGEVDVETLVGRAGGDLLLDVMAPVPTTVRPSVTVASVAGAGGGRRLVTTSGGRLLGEVQVEPADHQGHDHEGHDHEYDREMTEVLQAVQERFGDREPSEDELRSFLHERLVAEGRSPEDAHRFLDQLEQDAAD